MKKLLYPFLLLSFLSPAALFSWEEDFAHLDNWEPLIFPKIENPSHYSTVVREGKTLLEARSDGGASGLIFKEDFSVYETPVLTWRWKTDRLLEKGDGGTKEGDDYPIRVYVIFEYDPETADRFTRLQYGTAKLLYGAYPPDSALNYLWANRRWEEPYRKNAYTDRAMMIPADQGEAHLGSWRDHRVNLLEDYRKVFGQDPPARASLALMTDSDNTGESTLAWIDFITLKKE
ncbi:MAG: DUF3047 domain-containing protein [Spirochaetales bacterium]|nr:DUF3047 domain-containing protein [Spirochaetales bacterium]